MRKYQPLLRICGLVSTAVVACSVMAGPAVASSAVGGSTAIAQSTLRCYATRSDPRTIVCYRLSQKAEYRHGQIVYIPRLIQVPTPDHPPAPVIVDSLGDIRPSGPG